MYNKGTEKYLAKVKHLDWQQQSKIAFKNKLRAQ
jgi:hypothetical protein